MGHGIVGAFVVSLAALASASAIPNANIKLNAGQLRSRGYDFVVVGGGTTGLTVADRLSEAFPNSMFSCSPTDGVLASPTDMSPESVLVVEYGEVESALGSFDEGLWAGPSTVGLASRFSFPTLPNTEMSNRTATPAGGKLVGGSSAVNGHFFDRGSKFDYDAWHEVGGSEFARSEYKWNWRGMFPYFKKVSRVPKPPGLAHHQ